MRIHERRMDGAIVLDVKGQILGHRTASLIAAAFGGHERPDEVLIANLAKVTSMDGTCLDAIVEAYRAMKRAGGELRLAGVTARLHDLVVIARLLTVCDTFDTVEAAVGRRTPAYPDAAMSPDLNGGPLCATPQLQQA